MPRAEIVAERFHIMKQVNDSLDRARNKFKRETESLKNPDKKETILSGLKRSKFAWLKNQKNQKSQNSQNSKKLSKSLQFEGKCTL